MNKHRHMELNPKTTLQEFLQRSGNPVPVYECIPHQHDTRILFDAIITYSIDGRHFTARSDNHQSKKIATSTLALYVCKIIIPDMANIHATHQKMNLLKSYNILKIIIPDMVAPKEPFTPIIPQFGAPSVVAPSVVAPKEPFTPIIPQFGAPSVVAPKEPFTPIIPQFSAPSVVAPKEPFTPIIPQFSAPRAADITSRKTLDYDVIIIDFENFNNNTKIVQFSAIYPNIQVLKICSMVHHNVEYATTIVQSSRPDATDHYITYMVGTMVTQNPLVKIAIITRDHFGPILSDISPNCKHFVDLASIV